MDKWPTGMLVRASAKYKLTFPNSKPRIRGVVLGTRGHIVRVMWPNLSDNESLHETFIEPENDATPPDHIKDVGER